MKSLSTTNNNLFSREFYKRNSQKVHNKQNLFNLLGVFNFTLLLALSASLLFASPKSSEAATTSARAGSSVYYASISNEDSVAIPVTPTATQTEYTNKASDSKITFSSTCPKGSYVYINTSSSDNNLTRTGSDTGTKTIKALATGVSGLTDNTWGYKVNGSAFSGVPISSSPVVLYESTKVETNTSINVVYGVKVDNTIPSGTYSNDVVYTLVVDNKCLQYTLSFVDEDGSTKLYPDINVNYGDTADLTSYAPTKTGYTFAGWTNGSSTFTGKVNPNMSNVMEVTLKAYQRWEHDFGSTEDSKLTSKRTSWTPNQSTWPERADDTTANPEYEWMTDGRIKAYSYDLGSYDSTKNPVSITTSGNTKHVGNLYNFFAASAGADRFEQDGNLLVTANPKSVTPDSICPKGWRIPYMGITADTSRVDDTSVQWANIFAMNNKSFSKLFLLDADKKFQTWYRILGSIENKPDEPNFGSQVGAGSYNASEGYATRSQKGSMLWAATSNSTPYRYQFYGWMDKDNNYEVVMGTASFVEYGLAIRCVNR